MIFNIYHSCVSLPERMFWICWVKSNSMQQYHNELILSYLLVINMVPWLEDL